MSAGPQATTVNKNVVSTRMVSKDCITPGAASAMALKVEVKSDVNRVSNINHIATPNAICPILAVQLCAGSLSSYLWLANCIYLGSSRNLGRFRRVAHNGLLGQSYPQGTMTLGT